MENKTYSSEKHGYSWEKHGTKQYHFYKSKSYQRCQMEKGQIRLKLTKERICNSNKYASNKIKSHCKGTQIQKISEKKIKSKKGTTPRSTECKVDHQRWSTISSNYIVHKVSHVSWHDLIQNLNQCILTKLNLLEFAHQVSENIKSHQKITTYSKYKTDNVLTK